MGRVWAYVDAQHTHDVRVAIQDDPRLRLVIREGPFGAKDPADMHTVTMPIETPLEGVALVREVEARLAALGTYWHWRTGAAAWTLLSAPPLDPMPDLAPIAIEGFVESLEFHHFRHPSGGRTTLLVGMPHVVGRDIRYVLARVELAATPKGDPALTIIHSRLAPHVYRSVLLAECQSLAASGHRKETPADAAGSAATWWRDVLVVIDGIVARLSEGRNLDKDWRPTWRTSGAVVAVAAPRPKGPGASEIWARDIGGHTNYAVEPEDLERAGSAPGKAPSVMIEDAQADLRDLLADPRILALKNRLVGADVAARLLKQGERAIRDEVKRLRASAPAQDQHLLSIVEASLLVRYALAKRARLDAEAMRVLRHAPAYL